VNDNPASFQLSTLYLHQYEFHLGRILLINPASYISCIIFIIPASTWAKQGGHTI